ncbi:hypothetical protein C1C98_08785 [Pseudomonas ogarae]|uniref:Uncharacterized protein n=1 Tax=Pseudomonas ogarae (strain DSM 112162 / CECT 30235 / F113) TaxID=1114970 RepID=A0ABN5GAP3_PSEO1|nr:hypothetical protein C1C98_08785 [Pseudomonas ogarae]
MYMIDFALSKRINYIPAAIFITLVNMDRFALTISEILTKVDAILNALNAFDNSKTQRPTTDPERKLTR